jgi:MFS family permease
VTTFTKTFADKLGTSPKAAAASVVLAANAFIWYLYANRSLAEITGSTGFPSSEVSVVWGANILGTAVAALFGVFLVYHVGNRVRFLRYWMLAGVVLSLVPVAVDITNSATLLVYFSVVGAYFGLGMPVSLGYFAASTRIENRSRLGGIAFLVIFATLFILGTIGISSIPLNAVVLAAFEMVSLAVITVLKPEEKKIIRTDRVPYRFILTNKPFLLYFVPWMMFSIINYLTIPIVRGIHEDLFQQSMMLENALTGILAVVFGFLSDYIGRKRLVLVGFVLLGLGYASLGLLQENIAGWWFYTAADGVAWGVFYAIFLMTIWGDIAQGKSSEKYYAIGYLPFIFSIYGQLSLETRISSWGANTAVFSFASIFLFLAVLPLAYAPETLPDKVIKDRELRNYVEKAQRARAALESED